MCTRMHIAAMLGQITPRTLSLQVKAHSIIIATGATAKRLGIPSEEKFWSNGISACAICDGERHRMFASLVVMSLIPPSCMP